MLSKLAFYASLVLFSCSLAGIAWQTASTKGDQAHDATTELLGIETEYVEVLLKDSSRHGRVLYDVQIKTLNDKLHLIGKGAKQNHEHTYVYLVDDILRFRLPNRDYVKPEEEPKAAPRDGYSEIAKEVYSLNNEYDRHQNALSTFHKLLNRATQGELSVRSRASQTTDKELAKTLTDTADLLGAEAKLCKAQISKLEVKVATSNLEYIKKRRDAFAQGEYEMGRHQSNSRSRTGSRARN